MVDVAEVVRWLQLNAPRGGPDELSQLVARAAPAINASEIVIYLADYTQSLLVPLLGAGLVRDELSIETTLAGRAFTNLDIQRAPDNPDRVWVPLLLGCERMGVLEVVSPGAADEAMDGPAWEVAVNVAQILVNRRLYGDVVERMRRRLPMQVAAEIVWGLLPPLTFATDDLVITAILEPCYDVGGDIFDYALNDDVLSVGLFDTCGHGIKASTLASLVVSAYRNARRCGLDLVDTAISIDRWVRSEHPNFFATGLLIELDHRTGRLSMINAGHPGAMLLRDGKAIRELPGPTALPLGLGHLTPAAHGCTSRICTRATASSAIPTASPMRGARMGSSSGWTGSSTSSTAPSTTGCPARRRCVAWYAQSSATRTTDLRTTRPPSSWSGGRRTCRSRISATSPRPAPDRIRWILLRVDREVGQREGAGVRRR